ncbi:MAG: hypothetical protein PHQ66_02285 [Candidatus Nanoarchaeia archaeon]|nr:hypothetical protein [Candidatus Nanoarchaeia archaeon]MDD5357802.1 hypothetical protein [Candidatus Nanoarchaeia archaeon]MDD5588721.1 hypothetical protein [Candidatus Nanoarchaeia archaeon]
MSKIVALYSTRMLPDELYRNFRLKQKTIVPIKGDFSLMPAQISTAEEVYIMGNKFDTDIPKIVNHAKTTNKPFKIFSTVREMWEWD